MTNRSPILDEGVTVDPDALPTGETKRRQVRSLFDTIAPRYDMVNRIMSFGLDVRWRKASMKKLEAPAGSVIIDLACGTGDFCREIERHGMVAVGLDLSMGMLVAARTASPLVHADILAMPLADRSVDGATCGFALRNLIELEGFFDEVARVVRPGRRPDHRLGHRERPDRRVAEAPGAGAGGAGPVARRGHPNRRRPGP